MTELIPVRPEDKELLRSINQKYLYEMTNYYDDEMDEHGNYSYGYFDAYFTDPLRKALFIREDGRLAGFAMINPYSYINEAPDHVLAEFTVFPHFRGNHTATRAAEEIFSLYKGRWEVKYNIKNTAAAALWNKVTAKYSPRSVKYSDDETILVFTVE